MKTSKIAQLCKASREITLVNVQEEDEKPTQWVGTLRTIYPLIGFRKMDKDQIYSIFDVTEKQASNIVFIELAAEKIAFRLDARDATERAIEPHHISIVDGGTVYVPFDTSKGLRLVERAYLMAMTKDIELLSYCERQTVDGNVYIVARIGLLIVGVILPRYREGGDKDLQDFARVFADRMEYAWIVADAEKRARDGEDAQEQLMLLDEDTGELLESADEAADAAGEEPSSAKVTAFVPDSERQAGGLELKLREYDGDGGDAA